MYHSMLYQIYSTKIKKRLPQIQIWSASYLKTTYLEIVISRPLIADYAVYQAMLIVDSHTVTHNC